MAGLSAISLVLGGARELVIARELQATDGADLFFRGVTVVAAARNFELSLLRARWIPLPPGPRTSELLREATPSGGVVVGVALLALALMIPPGQWLAVESLVFAACIAVAVLGASVRALAERHGRENLGFVLEWLPLVGTIVGALAIPGRAVGPIAGLTGGLVLGTALLLPALRGPLERTDRQAVERTPEGIALYVDTLVYVNLGLVDSVITAFVLAPGQFALLNYGYLVVNAVLAVPTAGATIVALRLGGRALPGELAALRRWALLGGLALGGVVAAVSLALTWSLVAAPIDAIAGWALCDAIDELVLVSAPFAALRFANTVGRQVRVAKDPRGLVAWDLGGLVLRAAMLGGGALVLGPIASPLGLALAELVQLGTWIAWRPPSSSASA
jgi:hypothetical protein